MNSRVFSQVGGLMPPRSVFDLSYDKKFTCDMGELVPVMCDEVVPGDTFKINNQVVIRMQPMLAPMIHEVNCYVHYFFVPYRLLWSKWESFITGGEDGQDASILPRASASSTDNLVHSVWDYLGFPTGVIPDLDNSPLAFPFQAYVKIWNEFYRDQNLQDELELDYDLSGATPISEIVKSGNYTFTRLLHRCWEKDYFTSALPWQQRGTAPALPISGTTSAVWSDVYSSASSTTPVTASSAFSTSKNFVADTAEHALNIKQALNNNTVDLSNASTFDVADLRLAFQVQKWMERNARSGARYTEFLRSHFAVAPRDERLQRPEYIGGSKCPMIISEVMQTSGTESTTGTQKTPQGYLAGHGISVGAQFAGKYTATEYGLIMGIMSVMPRSAYQQGINRQWLRKTKYDFYFPEFAHLSEQAVTQEEIYASATKTENEKIFGYQARYNEMRSKDTMVCGEMRNDFNYWHLGRIFDSAPVLNSDFVTCNPSKRIFAVTDDNVNGLIVNFANNITAIRPLPVEGTPGLIDHN